MPEDTCNMTGLAKLRDTVGSLATRSLTRWIVLALVTAVIVGTAGYSYREINNELTAVTLSRRETVAQLAAITLAEKFGRVVDVAISLSTRVRVQELVAEGKWTEAIGYLHAVPRDLPQIERLFLADVGGTLMADVPALPGVRGTNFAPREWFQGVSRDWRPYVSPVYTRAAVPRLNVFAVAAPVKNATGNVAGILVLQIRIESLLEWIEAVDVGPEGFLYIVDSKGKLAFHSKHRDQEGIVELSGTTVVEKLRRGEHGVETGFDPAEREDSIVAYATVPQYGWGVVAQQPTRSSVGLATRDEQLQRLLTGYGLILLLGAATIFLISRIAIQRQRAEDDHRMKAELEQRVVERTAQLNAANKDLEAFSYSVAHDLRAPLRSIDGFSQVLVEDYAGQLDEPGKDHLNRVRAATQRMGHLIDDMLALARVTRAEMRRATVDLSALAADVLAELQKSEPERKVDCRIEPDLVASGDAQLLRVVLANLLGNAWKYTARQPHPRIEFGALRNADGAPTYFVRDNGAGFDMAYAGKLFGVFQRLHTLAEFPGTGVGLATVQRIVHRHGGQVRGEGMPDQGATFSFTLPA